MRPYRIGVCVRALRNEGLGLQLVAPDGCCHIESGRTKVGDPWKLIIDAQRAVSLGCLDLKLLDAGEKLHRV